MNRSALPLLALALGLGAGPLSAAEDRRLTFTDLMALQRVADPQVSPDGRWVVFTVTEAILAENRNNSDLWLVPADGSQPPRALTRSPKQDRHPRWSPDGRWIAFESNRDGEFQVWVIPADGGEATPLTRLATGASAPLWSPDGTRVAFLSSVFPEYSGESFDSAEAKNKARLEAAEKSKVQGRVFTQLPVRKWDSWNDGRRQHLFVVGVTNGIAIGSPCNLTPGPQDAVPWSSTFAAGDEFAWSPDGRLLVHTASPTPVREEAWKTDHQLVEVNVATGERRTLTTNPAADGCPRYSPDGRWLAYRAQSRPGFEADRWQLLLMDRVSGQTRSLTPSLDASVENLAWAPDSSRLYFEAEDRGSKPLWTVSTNGQDAQVVVSGGSNGELSVAAGGRLVFTRSRITHPAELFVTGTNGIAGGDPQPLTRLNAPRLAGLQLSPPESVTFNGAGGTPIQMWIVKPPGFDPGRRHPVVFWVHGGPQGAFLDAWSFRWNAALWAAQGYVIALPNPRGSTGFGQKFTDEISRDWGGKVFVDLMAGVAWLEQQPWVDASRLAAAGASYGGYMMNWFQGHTDRFKTLITHCGVFEFHSMYGTTDELWFDEWEHGIPWEKAEALKHSPDQFAGRFKTPNLVIHNELDYRVPIGQGLALFTALQRQGVPSKFLYFPDEGHWVLKPANSELWHRTIFEWLAEYLGKSGG